jgi:DNA-binding XRE family transcriptional regulator
MVRRRRSSLRFPLPFFNVPAHGMPRRAARALRPIIRTPAELNSAQMALAELERHRERDLEALLGLGVPAPILERYRQTMDHRMEVVRHQLDENEALRAGAAARTFPLSDLGVALVRMRIACGLTQRDLARALGVAESTVSRGERSQYAGVGIDRARRILQALGLKVEVTVSGLV